MATPSNNRYLLAFVYRAAHGADATNNGISANHELLFIPCPDGNYVFEELDVTRVLTASNNPHTQEIDFYPQGKAKGQFGGNFIYASDSRFTRHYGHRPLKIFDRYE